MLSLIKKNGSVLFPLGVLYFVLLYCFIGCNSTTKHIDDGKITYEILFHFYWNELTVPSLDIPEYRYFTPIIGMVHAKDMSLFEVNKKANTGIKDIALYGRTDSLISDISKYIREEKASYGIINTGIFNTPITISKEIKIPDDPEYSYISVISKVTPSPDWFVAIQNLPLYENKQWKSFAEMDMEIYDAGVDSQIKFDVDTKVPEDQVITPFSAGEVASIFGKIEIKRIK